MAQPLLDLIRKLIRSDTVQIGGPVGNMYGTVRADVGGLETDVLQTWALLEVAGVDLPALEEFMQAFLTNESRVRLLVASEGVVSANAAPGVIQLFRGVVDSRTQQTFHLTADIGSVGGECAVYLNGALLRRGHSVVTIPITVTAGRHVLAVVSQAPKTTITIPPSVRLIGETDLPARPIWESLFTGYLDERIGSASNTLRWFGASDVGGYRILRRQPSPVGDLVNGDGTILEIGEPGAGPTFGVVIKGDHTERLSRGVELLAGSVTVGIVVSAQPDDDGNTAVQCRVALGQSGVSQSWVGRQALVGSFTELARMSLTAATPIVEYVDTAVVAGRPYEYALQSYGMIDELALSPLSEVRYIVAGDLAPPGPIVIHADYPFVILGTATMRYTTPNDRDYHGFHVIFRHRLLNDLGVTEVPYEVFAISLDRLTVSIDDPELVPDGVVGYLARFGTSLTPYEVIANTAGDLTFSTEVAESVTVGMPIELYKDTHVKTVLGLPSEDDEIQFSVTQYGRFIFPTFDRSLNEQWDVDAAYWDYTTADDDFEGTALGPIVALRKLVGSEQQHFAGYEAMNLYALVEIHAQLLGAPATPPSAKYSGIKMYYQRRNDPAPIELAPIPDQTRPFGTEVVDGTTAILDDPLGVRSRFIALERLEQDNWIRFWAIHEPTELESDTITFLVDYDDTPEITSLETEVSNTLNAVNWRAVGDDDCRGLLWWVDPPDPEDPSPTSPQAVNMTTLRTVTRSVPLQLGQSKTLYVQPWGRWSPSLNTVIGTVGETVVRELVRTPRSFVTFDSKDASGNRSATAVTARFTVLPTPQSVASGTGVASGSGLNWTDVSKAWTANEFAASDLKHYYLRVTPTTPTVANPVVMRKVLSNTVNQLVLRNALPASAWGSNSYQIMNGAVEVQAGTDPEGTGGAFLPTKGTETYSRANFTYLRFYGTASGCTPENTRMVLIDPDDVPGLLGLDLAYDAEEHELIVSITGSDDDAKFWKLYTRKGEWPTMTAGAPTATPDQRFLRFSGSVSVTTVRLNVTSGTYYAVAVPSNSLGQDGPAVYGSIVIVEEDDPGNPGSTPGLTNLSASTSPGSTTAILWWGHTSGTVGTVTVRGGRTDLYGGDSLPVLTSGRNVTWDLGDSDTIDLAGHYGHSLGETVVSSGGISREWAYRVELYNPGLISTRTTTMAFQVSAIPPNAPNLSGVSVSVSGDGNCHPSGSCTVAHANIIMWSATDAPSEVFQIVIERTCAPLGPDTYQVWASGLDPYAGAYEDYDECVAHTTDLLLGMIYTWFYRVSLRRRSDGVTVSGPFTVSQEAFAARCWELINDGDEE